MSKSSNPSPPRQSSGRRRTKELQLKKRTTIVCLLKKAIPDPPCPSSFHLASLTESFTSKRPVPQKSTKTTSLQKMGRTALLMEMPRSRSLARHRSCHQSRPTKKPKQRIRQIRPMGFGNRLQDAIKDTKHEDLILI
jgi:hypothetical protein